MVFYSTSCQDNQNEQSNKTFLLSVVSGIVHRSIDLAAIGETYIWPEQSKENTIPESIFNGIL